MNVGTSINEIKLNKILNIISIVIKVVEGLHYVVDLVNSELERQKDESLQTKTEKG